MIDLSRALASAFVEGTAGERFKGRKTCTDARGQDKGHRAGCRDLWLCEALARHGSPLIRKEWAAFRGKAGQCTAWRGQVWRGGVRPGKARHGMEVRCLACSADSGIPGKVRPGEAWGGRARQGVCMEVRRSV